MPAGLRALLLLLQLAILVFGGKPCRGAHGAEQCVKLAQTAKAYQGYCKGCFAGLFPAEYAQIKTNGKKHCLACGAQRALTRSLCKPCLHTRCCAGCDALNLDTNAVRCRNCKGLRKSSGAAYPQLALWCTNCSTEEDRVHQLCGDCLILSPGPCEVFAGKPCRGAHGAEKCVKLAQTAKAYRGYCKGCFAVLFPVESAQIKTHGKKYCLACGAQRELTRSLCKPCLHTRCCAGCDALNLDTNAVHCGNCEGLRKSWGAAYPF